MRVAEVLRPLVEHAVVERAIGELVTCLRQAMLGHDRPLMRITARPELVQAITSHVPDLLDRIVFIDSDDWTVRVDAGVTGIGVDLDAWRHSIRGAAL